MKTKAKILTIVAALSITVSSATASFADAEPAVNPFADTYGKWYEDSVSYVYSQGLLKGFEDSLFHPESNISRAELATILYRLYCESENSPLMTPSPTSKWYEPAMNWAARALVTENIITDNDTDPDKSLKREEIISMVYKAYTLSHEPGELSELTQFSDSNLSSPYAADALKWAVKNQIIMGDDKQMLNPKNNVTRGETSAIIERYLKNCDFEAKKENNTSIPNPIESFAMLEDAERAAGYDFPVINLIDFKADSYNVINKNNIKNSIIEVIGTYQGKRTEIRTGMGDRAISGIYGGEALEDGIEGISVDFMQYEDIIYAEWARDIDEEIYCYSVAIENGTVEDISKFVNEIGADVLVPISTPQPTDNTNSSVSIANPIKNYSSIIDAQNAVNLAFPDISIDEFTPNKFYTINESDLMYAIVAEEGSFNGKATEIRMGLGDRDISGIYGGESIPEAPGIYSVLYRKYNDTAYATWSVTIDNVIYCYSVSIEKGTVEDLNLFVDSIGAEALIN